MYNNSMFNKNSFKTSIMFLLLILFGIIVRMFLIQDELFVKGTQEKATANIFCGFDGDC